MRTMIRGITSILTLGVLLVPMAHGQSRPYPNKTIRMIVPFRACQYH